MGLLECVVNFFCWLVYRRIPGSVCIPFCLHSFLTQVISCRFIMRYSPPQQRRRILLGKHKDISGSYKTGLHRFRGLVGVLAFEK